MNFLNKFVLYFETSCLRFSIFFCFHDDEDLRLKERKLALILKIDAAYGSTFWL